MTERDRILMTDKLPEIEKSFTKDGWLTVYKNDNSEDTENFVYCCLVDSKTIGKYKRNSDWVIHAGQEGKPAVITSYKNGRKQTRYQSYSEKGVEPFIFSKTFNYHGGYDKYVDISEEFVLYFKLYEKIVTKEDRMFYFIDDSGELHEVIDIKPSLIKVKLKYLMEYLAIRKSHLSVCFDYMRFSEQSVDELSLQQTDDDIVEANKIYNIFIRPFGLKNGFKTQSWVRGKVIISPPKGKSLRLHFQADNKFEKYITGYDDNGNEVQQDCSKTNEKYFVLTYFKKEVLDKYYNEPEKYTVTGMNLTSNFFSLKMDNNHITYVAVFLVELRMLPHNEQLHWRQYNIPPQSGISQTYYRTMIEGKWAESPETPDLYFKYKFEDFNDRWEKQHGWRFYKPLEGNNEYRLKALHIPSTNNIKTFCEQILSLVIITIDSLNEKEIAKNLDLEKGDKGISKFEKFLKHHNKPMPKLIEFLRNLQDLRSGLMAHRFSSSEVKIQKAMEYFGIKDGNYIDVATDIFTKSVFTLNSLEKHFLHKPAAHTLK